VPTLQGELAKVQEEKKRRSVKCVVWDLDNTIWRGVLLEDKQVTLVPNVTSIIKTLDGRGILQSISSKNDYDTALAKLQEFAIAEYFVYPQIGWNSKSEGVKTIAQSINIGLDSLAFIDDQPFEREEVRFSAPSVLCVDAAELDFLLDRPEFTPRFITSDSKKRRQMYLSDIERNQAEKTFSGPQDAFLATLGLKFTLGHAGEEDLQRAEELTMRTHQLNTTGYTYSYDELNQYRQSTCHKLLIAGLADKYGSYGKIGLALIECGERYWMLKLLLMSCRVMSRGVGTIMVNYILRVAKAAGVTLRAEFISTDRNRMMYITYKLGNFRVIQQSGDLTIFENDCSRIQEFPPYVEVEILPEAGRKITSETIGPGKAAL
jgi:FkbH-like protein